MNDIAIRVDNLGKQYRIGKLERYQSLRDSLARAFSAPARWLGSAFKRGHKSGNGEGADTESIWALRDVSFEVSRGEVVGIIGRNGAGKSTLLKILSRITEPSTGEIEVRGRVGSLLEVGTGFHPELTGRENVYLNGAILGMKRSEISRKFDEIVAFAETEKFLDTAVKYYSSGMYMRLAFAVAAHLEPEILIVDEVLAVGDAQFQKKCLGKMGDVAKGGRTVLFVSHNIGAVLTICNQAILLGEGRLRRQGGTKEVVSSYFANIDGVRSSIEAPNFRGPLTGTVRFHDLVVNKTDAARRILVAPADGLNVTVQGEARMNVPDFRATFSLYRDGIRLLSMHDVEEPQFLPKGPFELSFEVPPCLLRPGEYSIALGGKRVSGDDWVWGTDLATFTVLEEWCPGCDREDLGLVNSLGRGWRRSGSAQSKAMGPATS